MLRHVLTHLVMPLLMCVGMGLAYLGAFHAPKPNHLGVAVVGSTPQVQVLAQTLKDKAGSGLDVTTVADQATARHELMNRQLVGAYVPDAATPTLLVASANSDTSATAAEKVFTAVAAQTADRPLTVTELTPLASGDPTGQGLFFLLVAVSIGSYASVAVIGGAGGVLRMRVRGLLVLGASLVVSLIGLLLAGPVFHLVDHDLAAVWALSWAYSAGVMAVGTALHTFLGRWTTLGTMLLFVMLNFTSSGGIYRPDLQNGFFGSLHAFWNGAGFLEGARNAVYFDGRGGLAGNVLTLAVWLVVGAAFMGVASLAEKRRRPLAAPETPAEREEELEEAVAA
jgi:hypothetical protein